jgi:hypothetical protein
VAERAGLTPERLDQVVAAIGEALDGRRLARQELGEELANRLGRWVLEEAFPAYGGAWPRWWPAIGQAAARGVLCFGPNQGNRVTFVRPDQWVDGWREVEGRQAIAEVFRRFVAAYGPVSPSDFAPWFGMRPAAATELARSLGDQVEEVDVEGYRGLLPAGEQVAGAGGLTAGGSVVLLPSFDCYVRGWSRSFGSAPASAPPSRPRPPVSARSSKRRSRSRSARSGVARTCDLRRTAEGAAGAPRCRPSPAGWPGWGRVSKV